MVQFLKSYVCVEVFWEKERKTFKKYDIDEIPVILVITPEGREVGRFYGFLPPGKFIEAVKDCTAAEENLKKGQKLLSEDPKSAKGLYLRGLGRFCKRKAEEAKADLKKVAAQEPEGDNKYYVRAALWKLAQIAQSENDNKVRDSYLEKLVAADPKNESGFVVEVLYTLGVSAMVKKDIALMKERFKAAMALDPEDRAGFADDIAFAEAFAPFYARKFKEAAANLEEFIKNHEKSELLPKAYYQMAICCYYLKDRAKTASVLGKLVEKYPRSPEAQKAEKLLKRLKK